MKKFLPLLYSFFLCIAVDAQVYDGPESVEYDAVNNRWLISNTGSGTILSRDASGNLTVFAGGFTSGPHGIEIVGNSVYACTGGSLRILDLTTGAQTALIAIGGTFLNGITHDNNGNIFMTDFSAKKVYRYDIASQQFNVFVTGLSSTPNGIVFDESNSRLVMVNWGNSAPVTGISLNDSTASTITATTLNYCDGITMDCDDNFYISTWQPAKIVKYDNSFSAPVNVVTTGLSNPADIFYAQALDTLGVPNSGNDAVTFHPFTSCLGNGIADMISSEQFSVYTSENNLHIEFPFSPDTFLSVIDISGREVWKEVPVTSRILIPCEPGIYIVRYKNTSRKIIVAG